MIADSGKHIFEAVFVYQLDHFAVIDTTAPSIKPKKNGVRVIPAREISATMHMECLRLVADVPPI